jgi:transcriptional regulator with XRE-family HTH domain
VANDVAQRLMARVKQIREAREMSQEAFAERAGLDYKYYQHIEAGRKRDLRISTLEKLANGCGLKLWELLNFDTELPAMAEDPASYGSKKTPAKKVRKSPKRPPPGKEA